MEFAKKQIAEELGCEKRRYLHGLAMQNFAKHKGTIF